MKLCAVQPHMSDSIDENVRVISNWIHRASESGADVVVFPEMMLTGYGDHLFELFKQQDWYARVEDAFGALGSTALEADVSLLVGSPYRTSDGYLNALVLLQAGETPVLVGGRTHIEEGVKKHWGFSAVQDRTPLKIRDVAFGSLFCDESVHLNLTSSKGLEKSEVILWPSVTCSAKDEHKTITNDNASEGAKAIARWYGVPVIHANYISYASQHENERAEAWGRTLGGSVACDASGQILDQASWTEEEMRSFEICRVDGTVVVTPIEQDHVTGTYVKTFSNE